MSFLVRSNLLSNSYLIWIYTNTRSRTNIWPCPTKLLATGVTFAGKEDLSTCKCKRSIRTHIGERKQMQIPINCHHTEHLIAMIPKLIVFLVPCSIYFLHIVSVKLILEIQTARESLGLFRDCWVACILEYFILALLPNCYRTWWQLQMFILDLQIWEPVVRCNVQIAAFYLTAIQIAVLNLQIHLYGLGGC